MAISGSIMGAKSSDPDTAVNKMNINKNKSGMSQKIKNNNEKRSLGYTEVAQF